jgi:hypothetical protein
MGAAAPRKHIRPQPLSWTVPGIQDKCLLATYYRIARFHMSQWLYKCFNKPILPTTILNSLAGNVFSVPHTSAQTLSYTRFIPWTIHVKVSCLAFSYPQIHFHLKLTSLNDSTCAYLAAGFEPLALHCLLKPILQLTVFNDSSGKHFFLRSTLS